MYGFASYGMTNYAGLYGDLTFWENQSGFAFLDSRQQEWPVTMVDDRLK